MRACCQPSRAAAGEAIAVEDYTDAARAAAAATEQVHFIGKDILYFHALFWPAMLKFAGYNTPASCASTASSPSTAPR
mgnify:CR=1 FL=1